MHFTQTGSLLYAIVTICTLGISGCFPIQSRPKTFAEPYGPEFGRCIERIDQIDAPLHHKEALAVKAYGRVICMTGLVKAGTSFEVVQTVLKQFDRDKPLTLVIGSTGGDVDEAIKIGRLIHSFNTAVYVYNFCASSCANFIFSAGDKKIVLPNALLAFHGGASLNSLENLAEQVYQHYEKAGDPGAEQGIEQVRKDLAATIDNQEAYLTQVGIDKHLFRWMDLYHHMPEQDRLTLCPKNPVMIIYDPDVLAKFGYTIDRYQGPVNQKQVDQLLAENDVERNMCYWPQLSYLVE